MSLEQRQSHLILPFGTDGCQIHLERRSRNCTVHEANGPDGRERKREMDS